MERAGGKDRGTLSQWRGRKIIAEMVEPKVMEVPGGDHPRPRSPQPPAGWLGDEERRCEEQPNPVGCRTADPYQPDHPTSLLPDHHHRHPPRMAHSKIKFYLKKPLLDPKHQIMQFDLGHNQRRSNIPSVAENVFCANLSGLATVRS